MRVHFNCSWSSKFGFTTEICTDLEVSPVLHGSISLHVGLFWVFIYKGGIRRKGVNVDMKLKTRWSERIPTELRDESLILYFNSNILAKPQESRPLFHNNPIIHSWTESYQKHLKVAWQVHSPNFLYQLTEQAHWTTNRTGDTSLHNSNCNKFCQNQSLVSQVTSSNDTRNADPSEISLSQLSCFTGDKWVSWGSH